MAESYFFRRCLKRMVVIFRIHLLLFLHDGRFRKVLKALIMNCSVYAMLLSSMILRAKCFLNSFSFVFCVSSLIIIPMITARFILG